MKWLMTLTETTFYDTRAIVRVFEDSEISVDDAVDRFLGSKAYGLTFTRIDE